MRHNLVRCGKIVLALVALGAFAVPSFGKSPPLEKIELGLVLSTEKEDHCFIFGPLGLSEEKSKDYLSGLGHDLAFSDKFAPAWPKWDFVRISSVYCQAGVDGAGRFIGMMEDPSGIVKCETIDQLLENCNCVALINTGGVGADNFELVSACLQARRPTFVDKFLAADLSEARILLKMARELDVPLVSSSYIWTSQPGLELRKQLAGKKLTKVISTGWSSGKVTGAIHTIAQLQLLSENRRPLSVRVDKEAEGGAKAVVTFDDGLVGEMIPRAGGEIFGLQAVADGTTYKAAPYEAKHSRPSPINLYSLFFDYVRGKNRGQAAHLMEDALAIWEATEKSIETGAEVAIDTVLAEADARLLKTSTLEFRTPTVAHPYYHFALQLELPEAGQVFVHELQANGVTLRNYSLHTKGESIDPRLPNTLRRLAIAQAIKSPRPERVYQTPTLLGRLDWQNGKDYRLKLKLSVGSTDGTKYWKHFIGAAPAKGGYWNPDWKCYQSVVVTETVGRDRSAEPVETTHLFYLDQVADPQKEFRVVHYDVDKKTHHEVPSQVLDFDQVDLTEAPMYDEDGELKPPTFLATSSATIVFPARTKANRSSVYLVFYNNPQAPLPSYQADLAVRGNGPGVAIENDDYLLKLHSANGMLDEVTLKAKPEHKFVHKKETNGAIQWNPGCYSPPRAWAHLSDWEPGKYDYKYEERRGPLVFYTRRWGMMPIMPEVACSMTYKFYAGVPYFSMRSSTHVRFDVAVQALRNAEVVFAREAFSEAAWFDPITKRVETRHITSAPDLTEWVIPEDTPWVAFFDRAKGCGYAGIQRQHYSGGLDGELRTLNPYLYVTTGPWVYWTRALLYPYGSRNPQQMIRVDAGSVFLEEWAYLPFKLSADQGNLFREVENWREILANPLRVHLEDPIDPRMQVPKEIYLEPEKTGWEEG